LLDRLEPGHQHPPIASFNDAQIVRGRAGLRKMVGGYSTTSTPRLTGAGARSAQGTNTGHENGEAMASVGVRVEPTVRNLRRNHWSFSHFSKSASFSNGDCSSPRIRLDSAVMEILNFSALASDS